MFNLKNNFLSKKLIPFVIAAFSLIPAALFSQTSGHNNVGVKKDSSQIYKDLQNFASKRKSTSLIFQGIFKDTKTGTASRGNKKTKFPLKENYKKQQGKIIRNIRIITIDPLGLVQGDTIAYGKSWLEKSGNKVHVRTLKHTIKNQLLFQQGELLDSLNLIESERILRLSDYLSEAKIRAVIISRKNDSIDVLVTVRDLWSIKGTASISPSSNNMVVNEKNFLGLSHQISNTISFNLLSPQSFASAGSYFIPNIKNTFITGRVFYNASAFNDAMGISFDRGFFSPLTKWAGGISVSTNHDLWPYILPDSTILRFPVAYHAEDLWLGRSFSIKKHNDNAYKDPRILITGRVYDMQFLKRPSTIYDILETNQGNLFYISSIGYTTRSYYKDQNIYKFGKVEDVPEGELLAIIGGFQKREFFAPRLYYGFKMSFGKHISNLGYLAGNLEHGTFIQNGKSEKGVINMGLYFFNDLWCFGKWSMRQFFDLHVTSGIRRDPTESININGNKGLYGFNSGTLTGKGKAVLTLANQIYLPFQVIGFHFASFIFASFAGIGDNNHDLLNGKLYQGYGIGLLIRNEFLVINTFQLSIGYYPEVPGFGNNVFKFNPLSVSDLKFNDLYFSKPDFIGYN